MELYDRITNICGKNYEEELIEAIKATTDELKELDKDQMCKVYSSYLLRELAKRHIPSRLVNTKDLGLDYEHAFLLVSNSKDGYFLADLTFQQFNQENEEFKELLKKGYQTIDGVGLNNYLTIIGQSIAKDYSLEELFYQLPSRTK